MRLTERCTLSSLYFDREAGAWYDMHFCAACVQICDAHGVEFVQAATASQHDSEKFNNLYVLDMNIDLKFSEQTFNRFSHE